MEKRDKTHGTVLEIVALTVCNNGGDGIAVNTGHLDASHIGGIYVSGKDKEDVGVLADKLFPHLLGIVGNTAVDKDCAR